MTPIHTWKFVLLFVLLNFIELLQAQETCISLKVPILKSPLPHQYSDERLNGNVKCLTECLSDESKSDKAVKTHTWKKVALIQSHTETKVSYLISEQVLSKNQKPFFYSKEASEKDYLVFYIDMQKNENLLGPRGVGRGYIVSQYDNKGNVLRYQTQDYLNEFNINDDKLNHIYLYHF